MKCLKCQSKAMVIFAILLSMGTACAAALIEPGTYYYIRNAIPLEVIAKFHEIRAKEPLFTNPDEKFQEGDYQ